jgi:hypothetical protein
MKWIITILICVFTFNESTAQWLLTGNAPAAGQFLGTTTNTPLLFRTNTATAGNNVDRMVILPGGNVGIGITPTEKLHVAGNILTSGTISAPGAGGNSQRFGPLSLAAGLNSTAIGTSSSAAGQGSVAIGYATSAGQLYSTSIGSAVSNNFAFSTVIGATASATGNNATAIGYGVVASEGATIIGNAMAGGRVNVGSTNNLGAYYLSMAYGYSLTATANNQLLLGSNQPGYFTNEIRFNGINSNVATAYGPLQLRSLEGSGANIAGQTFTVYAGGGTGTGAGGDFAVYTAAPGAAGSALNAYTDKFRVTAAGKVSIGASNTSDVDYKLFVDKGIKTQKVKVTQAGWPDYVFHQQYKLPSLIEVEKFIKANNHLPEVPSAKEIETDGLNLGDNQATLLKKIEELTLYAIDANKKIEQQQKLVEQQQQQINLLQQQSEIIKQLQEEVKKIKSAAADKK